jgi:hypothetical protein
MLTPDGVVRIAAHGIVSITERLQKSREKIYRQGVHISYKYR